MRYRSLACDYDGTLATLGRVPRSTFEALERLRASGRKLILVTGRELHDLLSVFPENHIFESIVAENGALLYSPASGKIMVLAGPPPPEFVEALRQRNVEPLSVGHSIVATMRTHDLTVLDIIDKLGLDLQMIYNKESIMVLPFGVDKGTGLLAALSDLGLSRRETVGVGDGENDLALLDACEVGVAVGNAIPALKERADFTMSEPEGKGVEQLIERLLLDDLRGVEAPRCNRNLS